MPRFFDAKKYLSRNPDLSDSCSLGITEDDFYDDENISIEEDRSGISKNIKYRLILGTKKADVY